MLEKGYDPTKIIQTAKNSIDYFACVSQVAQPHPRHNKLTM